MKRHQTTIAVGQVGRCEAVTETTFVDYLGAMEDLVERYIGTEADQQRLRTLLNERYSHLTDEQDVRRIQLDDIRAQFTQGQEQQALEGLEAFRKRYGFWLPARDPLCRHLSR